MLRLIGAREFRWVDFMLRGRCRQRFAGTTPRRALRHRRDDIDAIVDAEKAMLPATMPPYFAFPAIITLIFAVITARAYFPSSSSGDDGIPQEITHRDDMSCCGPRLATLHFYWILALFFSALFRLYAHHALILASKPDTHHYYD